ncbi:MAG: BclA C-terminal domain-containing protein [Christensenellales bacterium]|jgi:hypothetical protein
MINIELGGGNVQIELDDAMPASNTTLGTNTITIVETGTYEIEYMVLVSFALAVGLSSGVRVNNVYAISTFQSRILAAATETLFSGSTIIDLTAGDVVDLAVNSLAAVSVPLGAGLNAYLTVKKISV